MRSRGRVETPSALVTLTLGVYLGNGGKCLSTKDTPRQ